jgi:hypothetical protein
MNTKDVLNAHLFAQSGDNARRKDIPYYDTLTVAAGQTEYFFFTTPIGNQFLRNTQLPLSGQEVFFLEAFSAYFNVEKNTLAEINALNEVLQQSFLEISVDNRVIGKYPGMDFINYLLSDTVADQVVVTVNFPKLLGNRNGDGFLGRKLPLPIILNSTSAFSFRWVCTAASATAFDTINMTLVLHGLQIDKLDSFYWDNLKNNQYQQVPVTYYDTVPIPNNAQQTYQLFTNPARVPTLFSKTFPLSDITTFSCQNIEVFVNQPDVPIDPSTILNSRLFNTFRVAVDDVERYNANLMNMLSMLAGFGRTLTSTPDTDYVTFLHLRQSKTLRIPLEVPANSNVQVELTQPAASLGITGEITVAMRGVETRRVA